MALSERQRKLPAVVLPLPEALIDALWLRALAERVTLTEYIELVLSRHCEAPDGD
jgi:hypothetical protein